MNNEIETLRQARQELADLLYELTYGPDGGADAGMLMVAHRADMLAALIKQLEVSDTGL